MTKIRKFSRYFAPDSRDWDYLAPKQAAKKNSKHWKLKPALNQLDTAECVGFSLAAWFAAEPISQHPIRPSGIYRLAQYLDEWEGVDYEGTSVRAGAKVLEITGHIKEYCWAFDAETVVNYIINHGPVVLGTDWYSGMDDIDTGGFLSLSGRLRGGHAYLAYGANIKKGYVSIRNSWGSDWGLAGSAKMWIEDLNMLLEEDGEACMPVEARV